MASVVVEKDMYGERYHLTHNPFAKGSQPRYTVIDRKKKVISYPKGATTILGEVIAKDFVGWALDCMEDTINKKLYELAKNDEYLTTEQVADAKLESARRRDSGASSGSEAHAMIEHYLRGEDVVMSKVSAEAGNAFGAFYKWFEGAHPEVVGVEDTIYSPKYNYAGTYDALMQFGDKLYLVDFKTTNTSRKAPQGIYPEYFLQLGAYAGAIREEYPESVLDGLMVVSVRKDGKMSVATSEDVGLSVKDCIGGFRKVCELHKFLRDTTKELGGR